MQYFDTLPKVIHTDAVGTSKIVTNIMSRVSIVPQLLKNPLNYYQYDIQEGDTPEIVAHKYYGDSYRYWIVMLSNELMDPQWDWPMNGKVFAKYLDNKYPNVETTSVIHHYEKIITQYDNDTMTTTVKKLQITEDVYNGLPTTQTTTYTLPAGDVVVTVETNAVSIYDYELGLNEDKRNIKLLNSIYVNQIETEYQKLMSV
jgi:hypothetical protein